MIASLNAVVMIVATWLVLCGAFIGIGLAVGRRFYLAADNRVGIFDAFWTGFAAIIWFLQVWHLFFPITVLALTIVVICGLAALGRHRTLLRESLKPSRGWVFALLLVAAWMANHAAGPPAPLDSAVYHVQAVRWANTYAAVPGLGNLHDRLAFNTSSTLYNAMLNTGPWRGRAAHIATGLLVLMLLVQVLASAGRLRRRQDSAACVFDLLLLTPLVAVSIGGTVSTFSTDIPPAIVLLVAASRLFAVLSASPHQVERLAYDVLFIAHLAALAICLKINSLVFAPFLVVVAMGCAVFALPRRELGIVLRAMVTIAAVAGIPWVVHGIVLSGYPLFPSTLAGVSADWRVPAQLARAESAWVTVFARHSDASGLGWIRRWFFIERQFWRVFISYMALPLGIAAAMLLLRFVVARLRLGASPAVQPRAWLVMLAACCALLIWFVMAPSPRFGFVLFWVIAATCAAQVWPFLALRGLALVVLAGSLAVIPIIVRIPPSAEYRTWPSFIARTVVLPPGSDHGFDPMPTPDLDQFTTDSGLVLLVPLRDNQCLDGPLPCTPHPAKNLVTRRVWDGRPAFVTVGDWQQLYWPDAHSPFAEAFRRRIQN